MKLAILSLFGLFFVMAFVPHHSQAQRLGYIDTQIIVEKMKQYQEAQKELDRSAENWQAEIEEKKREVEKLRQTYLAEELLYTADMKAEKLKEIEEKEKELRDYQNKRFGYEGMLYIKRQELIEPLMEKVFTAVKRVAKKKKLDFIFDKASDLTMVYSNPVYNYTDFVLEELGLGDPADSRQNGKDEEEEQADTKTEQKP